MLRNGGNFIKSFCRVHEKFPSTERQISFIIFSNYIVYTLGHLSLCEKPRFFLWVVGTGVTLSVIFHTEKNLRKPVPDNTTWR